VGEIYLRTPYRALGYYEEPELTRQAFVPNPFGDDPADLVFRTGDYGRLLWDGNLEYLGRRDDQVKIRGVRVELGEIENLLRSHAGVQDVAVVDRDDADGNKYLCAYLVLAGGVATGELREHLSAHLPELMVPSAFVAMAELPRTLNGKIDRKALPTLEQVQAGRQDQEESRARTPVEEILGGIWCEVLRIPQVGLAGNFFELGGHSLLATQIISRVRESLGVELPLRVLFEAPTLVALASRIERGSGVMPEEPAITPAPRDGDLPLSYPQQRMWLLEQLSAGSSAFNLPLGLRLRGPLSVAALERTFSEVIRRHEILRTTFPVRNGVPSQVIGPAASVSLPLVDLSGLEEGARECQALRIATENARRPFDLTSGPLVRTYLLRLGEAEHVVVCTMHHLVGDAWSFDVLTAELSRLYGSFGQGEPSPLPELPIQYVDYAVWQRQWLTGAVLESRLAYWNRQLAGAPSGLSLPRSRPPAAVQSFRGARLQMVLPRELTEGLRALSRREGTTLFMTMLGGFLALLHQYTGEKDLVVGSVIANRDRAEVEKLIGFLATTLVLRVDLSGSPSFRELLGRVREVCLGAYAHQLPPEKLREEQQGPGGQRLFDVWFQMESAQRERLDLAGLEWERFAGERGNVRFELSLVLEESGEDVRGEMEYDADVFASGTIAQMAEDYSSLLTEMTVDLEQGF
jgi:acyl carrier protein